MAAARRRIVPFIADYAWTLRLEFGGEVGATKWNVSATDPSWAKWRPTDPTSPHWCDTKRLGRLMGANVKRAEDHGEPCKTVRDFIGEFCGLAKN